MEGNDYVILGGIAPNVAARNTKTTLITIQVQDEGQKVQDSFARLEKMTTDILRPQPTPDATIQLFLFRHRQLLELERKAEEEQTRLLNSKCSPSLLEQRGLALNGLGVSGISIGLGGKRYFK